MNTAGGEGVWVGLEAGCVGGLFCGLLEASLGFRGLLGRGMGWALGALLYPANADRLGLVWHSIGMGKRSA